MQAMLSYEQKLSVLTAPTDMIPLDMVSPLDIERILEAARTNFDYVIIDMPSTMVEWSQTVLESAHVYFATMELDMRSAQNTLRGISVEVQLPDGGKPIAQNADHGVPMAVGLPKNAMRKEIMKLAKSVHDINQADVAEAKG